ncbi:MAG: response regulator [Nitratireductor sp.]|nr:response regulator [Nitratireductor sp.]
MQIFMIVDDSPVIRKVGRRLIEDMGFVVVEAADAIEALTICRSNMPDAVLVDWDLAGYPGLDLIRDIVLLPGSEGLKIIYCTSELMVPEMTKAKRSGATGFIMKPFNRQVLADKFRQFGLIEDEKHAA